MPRRKPTSDAGTGSPVPAPSLTPTLDRSIAAIPRKHRPIAERVRALSQQFLARFDHIDLAEATAWAREELALAESIGWTDGIGIARIHLAKCLRRTSPDDAIAELEAAEQSFAERGDLRNHAVVCANLANCLNDLGRFREGLERLEQARALFAGTGDHKQTALHDLLIAESLASFGEYSRAVELARRGFDHARDLGDRTVECSAEISLGSIFDRMGSFDIALGHFERAVELSRGIDERILKCSAIAGLQGVLNQSARAGGDRSRLSGVMSEALETISRFGTPVMRARAENNAGSSSELLGDGESARAHFARSVELFVEARSTDQVSVPLSNLARLARMEGDFAGAIRLHERALESARANGSVVREFGVEFDLAETCEAAGDFAGALAHYRRYHEMHARVRSEEAEREIYGFRAQLELEQSRRMAESERHRAEELRAQLEAKQRELTQHTLALARQIELLASFRSEIREILKQADRAETAIQAIRDKLSALPVAMIDWARFELEFQQSYPAFRTTLLARYPELTKMEVKICSLLRIGLTSSDIASLLRISERSVEGHRYHIRAKLGLRRDQDIRPVIIAIE
jgi:tetratricopeptide (TPR) repeat protein/DNA-binding CsgD family transcriptional regulator